MTGSWPGGLHHNGMHDFVLRELEVGARVALAEDEDACMGADFRLLVAELADDGPAADDVAAADDMAADDFDEDGDAWC